MELVNQKPFGGHGPLCSEVVMVSGDSGRNGFVGSVAADIELLRLAADLQGERDLTRATTSAKGGGVGGRSELARLRSLVGRAPDRL